MTTGGEVTISGLTPTPMTSAVTPCGAPSKATDALLTITVGVACVRMTRALVSVTGR